MQQPQWKKENNSNRIVTRHDTILDHITYRVWSVFSEKNQSGDKLAGLMIRDLEKEDVKQSDEKY